MTFQPGQSGNPAGRAVGSRNKKTLAVEAALFDHAQELVQDLVRRAKNGEPAAMRLCMERILPSGAGGQCRSPCRRSARARTRSPPPT